MLSSKSILKAILLVLAVSANLAIAENDNRVRMGRDGSVSNHQATPVSSDEAIKSFTRNLTELAAQNALPDYVGNREYIRQIIESLNKKSNKAVMIVAPRGAGKTALVEAVAKMLYEMGKNDSELAKFRIYDFNANNLKAGTDTQGDLENRIKGLLDFFVADKHAILFIDEIHILFKDESPLTQSLKQPLSRGEILSIGATTTDEYKEYVAKDGAFQDRYNFMFLPEMTESKMVTILRKIKDGFQNFHSQKSGVNITISDEALQEIPKLVSENYSEDSLARKSIDIMDRVMARERLQLTMGTSSAADIEDKIEELDIEKKSLESDLKNNDSIEKRARLDKIALEHNVLAGLLKEEQDKNTVRFREADIARKTQELKNLIAKNPNQKTPEMANLESQIRFAQSELANAKISEKRPGQVERIDILNFIEQETGTDRAILSESLKNRLERMKLNLEYALVGQGQAANSITNTFANSFADVEERSGVGNLVHVDGSDSTVLERTVLSQTISDVTRGNGRPPLIIDFSILNEQTGLNALLGSDFGYVDSTKGGKLDDIRRNRKLVVVFKGLSKMHPELWKVIEPILVDGFVMDSRNNKLDFRNATLVTEGAWANDYVTQEKGHWTDAQIESKYNLGQGSLAGKDAVTKDRIILKSIMLQKGVPAHLTEILSSSSVVLSSLEFKDAVTIAERQIEKQRQYLESRYKMSVEIQSHSVADLLARLAFESGKNSTNLDIVRKMYLSNLIAQVKLAHPQAFESNAANSKKISIEFTAASDNKSGVLSVKQNGQVLGSNEFKFNEPKSTAHKRLNTKKIPLKATRQGDAGKRVDLKSKEGRVKAATDGAKKRVR